MKRPALALDQTGRSLKKRLAADDSSVSLACRLQHAELRLETLQKQLSARDGLVKSVCSQHHAQMNVTDVSGLPTGKPYLRGSFHEWTRDQVEDSLQQNGGDRDRKRISWLRKHWESDLANSGKWCDLSAHMCPIIAKCAPFERAPCGNMSYQAVAVHITRQACAEVNQNDFEA